jgi:hypothetical protein
MPKTWDKCKVCLRGSLGAFAESDENVSFLVFITPELNDSNSVNLYHVLTQQRCSRLNAIGLSPNNITAHHPNPQLEQAGQQIPFCQQPLFWSTVFCVEAPLGVLYFFYVVKAPLPDRRVNS